jgi:hypothetical protein
MSKEVMVASLQIRSSRKLIQVSACPEEISSRIMMILLKCVYMDLRGLSFFKRHAKYFGWKISIWDLPEIVA